MKNKFLFATLFILALFIFVMGFAQADTSQPYAVDESGGKLKGLTEYIEQARKDWRVPGMAVAVVKDGKLIYARGFGLRDIERKLPVDANTLFPIGSTSKAFTATCAALLEDEGKLEWDKPVIEYLPDFRLSDPFATKEATVKDMLMHRTGLPRHDLLWYGSDFTRKQIYDRLRYLQFSKSFRDVWQYNNLMYMTVGYLVGQLSGGTWEDFVRERIFTPLGMKNSNFSVEELKKTPNHSEPYKIVNDRVKHIPFRPIDSAGPAGSINSSVLEMSRWIALHSNGGKLAGKQFVSKENLDLMHSPLIVADPKSQVKEVGYSSYGFAWINQTYRNHEMVWHDGGIDGFYAMMGFMPEEKIGVAILTNLNHGQHKAAEITMFRVFDLLLGLKPINWNQRSLDKARKEKEQESKGKKEKERLEDVGMIKGTKPSRNLEEYTGEFENPAYGVISIEKDGDSLKGKFHVFNFPIKHYHYDVFMSADPDDVVSLKLSFESDFDGNIDSVIIPLQPGVDPIKFTRIPSKKFKDPAYLSQFTGSYSLQGKPAKVILNGEGLNITFPGSEAAYQLVPIRENQFKLKEDINLLTLKFVRDDSGKVIELILTGAGGGVKCRKTE